MSGTQQKTASEDAHAPRRMRTDSYDPGAPLRLPIGSAPLPSTQEFGLHGLPNAPLAGVLLIRRSRPMVD